MTELAPPQPYRLCRLDELGERESRGFSIPCQGDVVELFVVRLGPRVYGYRNRCPHTGAPLEWTPDNFLDLDRSFIQCAMHGALFTIENGKCLRGPCIGESLMPLDVFVEAGIVYSSNSRPSSGLWFGSPAGRSRSTP